jgi:hypothetical protein
LSQKFQAVLAFKDHGTGPPADVPQFVKVAFLTMQGVEVLGSSLGSSLNGSQLRVNFQVLGETESPFTMQELKTLLEIALEGHVSLSVLHVRSSLDARTAERVERVLGK